MNQCIDLPHYTTFYSTHRKKVLIKTSSNPGPNLTVAFHLGCQNRVVRVGVTSFISAMVELTGLKR